MVWDDIVTVTEPAPRSNIDLSASYHGNSSNDFGYPDVPEEDTPLIGRHDPPTKSSRRFSNFARRFRKGHSRTATSSSASGSVRPSVLPRQLSSQDHAEVSNEDSVASGFSLLEGVSSKKQKKSRSSSFGTMPDLGERRRSEDLTEDADQHETHSRYSSRDHDERRPVKKVIVERVEVVHTRPFFSMC